MYQLGRGNEPMIAVGRTFPVSCFQHYFIAPTSWRLRNPEHRVLLLVVQKPSKIPAIVWHSRGHIAPELHATLSKFLWKNISQPWAKFRIERRMDYKNANIDRTRDIQLAKRRPLKTTPIASTAFISDDRKSCWFSLSEIRVSRVSESENPHSSFNSKWRHDGAGPGVSYGIGYHAVCKHDPFPAAPTAPFVR